MSKAYLEKNRARLVAAQRKRVTEDPLRRAKTMVSLARRRSGPDVLFRLTVERVHRALVAGVCEATGLPFYFGKGRSPWAPSIDRIVPGTIYEDNGVKIVVWIYNAAKLNFKPSDVLTMSRALVGSEPS